MCNLTACLKQEQPSVLLYRMLFLRKSIACQCKSGQFPLQRALTCRNLTGTRTQHTHSVCVLYFSVCVVFLYVTPTGKKNVASSTLLWSHKSGDRDDFFFFFRVNVNLVPKKLLS